jgi:chromate reductase
MNKTRDVAVLVGSLRKESINRKVANSLVEVAPEGLRLGFVDIGAPGEALSVDSARTIL